MPTKDKELLSLVPYVKDPVCGKARASFIEKLLLPRRVRMTLAAEKSSVSTSSKKTARHRVIPTTPPDIFQKPRTRSALKEKDLAKYEEYFRSSRYFQATGKLPDEWLVHFTDEQLGQVKRAREKVVREKATAGESAWRDWISAKKRNPPPPSADKDKKRKPTLLSQEQRDAIWREWKVRKEKELAAKRAEEKALRDKLIEETLRVASRIRKHPVGVGLTGSPKPGEHGGGSAFEGHFPPPKKGTQRKRLPNAVQVALCQSSLSPYLVHPAKAYKHENIHALEELQQLRELSWKAGAEHHRLSLPELWRRRVERAKPTIFDYRLPSRGHHGRGHESHDGSSPSPPRDRKPRAAETTPVRSRPPPTAGSAASPGYAHDDFEVPEEEEQGQGSKARQESEVGVVRINAPPGDGVRRSSGTRADDKAKEDDARSVASDNTRYTTPRGDEEEDEEEAVEEEVVDDKDLIAKVPVTEEPLDFERPAEELPVDRPFKGDADYYSDDASFCSEGPSDDFDPTSDLPGPSSRAPRPQMADQSARPESRSSTSAGNRRSTAGATGAGEAQQQQQQQAPAGEKGGAVDSEAAVPPVPASTAED